MRYVNPQLVLSFMLTILELPTFCSNVRIHLWISTKWKVSFYWIFLSMEGDLTGKEIIIFTLLSIPLHRHEAPAKCLYLC